MTPRGAVRLHPDRPAPSDLFDHLTPGVTTMTTTTETTAAPVFPSPAARVGIAAGYRLAVVAPSGEIVGSIDLEGYDLTLPGGATGLADDVLDQLPGSAVVPL